MSVLKLDPSKRDTEQHCNVEVDVVGRYAVCLPPIDTTKVTIPRLTVKMAVGQGRRRVVRVTYPPINVRRCDSGGVRHVVKYPDISLGEERICPSGFQLSFLEELRVSETTYNVPPRFHELHVEKYYRKREGQYVAFNVCELTSYIVFSLLPSPTPSPDTGPLALRRRHPRQGSHHAFTRPGTGPATRPATRNSSKSVTRKKANRQQPYGRGHYGYP